MASIDIQITGSQPDDEVYRLVVVAQSPVGMPAEIFLFNAATLEFSNVCIVRDFIWSTTPAPEDAYYRADTVTLEYPSLARANKADSVIRQRVQTLVDQVNADTATFIAVNVYSFT